MIISLDCANVCFRNYTSLREWSRYERQSNFKLTSSLPAARPLYISILWSACYANATRYAVNILCHDSHFGHKWLVEFPHILKQFLYCTIALTVQCKLCMFLTLYNTGVVSRNVCSVMQFMMVSYTYRGGGQWHSQEAIVLSFCFRDIKINALHLWLVD